MNRNSSFTSKHFYFVRHGQTDANHQRILQGGSIDLPLNLLGTQQAQELAPKIASLVFEQIYVSPLKRASQTAQIICPELQHKFMFDDRIKEWSLGEWEGQPTEQFMHLFLSGGEPKNGESRKVFYSRIEGFLQTVTVHPAPFLMVAHGGVWMVIQDLLGLDRFKIANCQLVELKFHLNKWHQRVI